MSRSGHLSGRLPFALTIGTALALAVSSVAVADTPLGDDLQVGEHRLRDSASKAGVKCFYLISDDRDGPATIRVRAPRVFARDRTSGRDSQKVGWQVTVRYSDDGTNFSTLFTSSVQKATTTDASVAPFTARDLHVTDLLFIRVRIRMYWFRPGTNNEVEGSSFHEVDYYDTYIDGTFSSQHGPNGYCGQRHGPEASR